MAWLLERAALALLPFPLLAQAPTPLTPPPLHGEAAAFDQARGRLVVFGGAPRFSGTWAWDGARWGMVADSAASPPHRSFATMAYDPRRRRIVLYGDNAKRFTDPAHLCYTWNFDGKRWAREHAGPCLTDRLGTTSLVYDARRRAMLLIDGTATGRDTVVRPMRIWRWTSTAWELVDSTGPRRQGFLKAAFDEARGVLVVPLLFGGLDAGMWEWDGARWKHLAVTGPSTRQTYALTYDDKSRRVVLMGGQGTSGGPFFDDAWTWDGAAWTEVPRSAGPAPQARAGAWLHRDRRHDRSIYFGGYGEGVPTPDLWLLDARGWHLWAPR